ncbi:MarR family winged helix-turn-helix transcriptional regulator [Streptomyces sp. NPDC087300]|uniref:MarR family winged helix-turn-helix transcriptional regulator n=1 Tax=Streptomyces sp. NPDC087300 TaxID=3365780 RepID=UPI003807EC16
MTTTTAPPAAGKAAESVLLSSLLDFAQAHQDQLVRTAADLGITVPQARALYHVVTAPTVRKLAVKLRCDASYVTGLVDRLEERKLMKRQVDPDDRRVKMLTLTAAGRRMHTKVARTMDTAPALEALTDEEKTRLGALLEKVSAQAPPGR